MYRICLLLFAVFTLILFPAQLIAGAKDSDDDSPATRNKVRGDAPCLSWVQPLRQVKAVILCVHGLGLHSGSYDSFGKVMSKKGYAVYAIDVRGFGSWMAAKGHQKVNFDACIDDIRSTLKSVRTANPDKPVFLLGESMGGAIAMQSAAKFPELINGLISSVPAGERFQQGKTDLKVALHMLTPNRAFDVGSGIMDQVTKNDELRDNLKGDPLARLKLSSKELIQFQAFMNKNHDAAPTIKNIPVLIVQGAKDKLVKPKGTAELFDELATQDKKMMTVLSAEHLIFEEGQFTDDVIDQLDAWINERLPHRKHMDQLSQKLEEARQLIEQQKYQEAIPILQQGLLVSAKNPEAHLLMGLIQAKQHRPLKAMNHLKQAMKYSGGPDNPQFKARANKVLLSLPPEFISPRLGSIMQKKAGVGPIGSGQRGQRMGLKRRGTTQGGAVLGGTVQGGGVMQGGTTQGAFKSQPDFSGQSQVLVFCAGWCEPCADLAKLIDDAETKLGNRVKFISIDVDDPKNEELMAKYNVSPVPTLVFLDSKGEIVSYSVGYAGVPGMIDGMSKLLLPRLK